MSSQQQRQGQGRQDNAGVPGNGRCSAPTLSLRIDLPRGRLGPGKIALLELVASTGSISAAGRSLGMSYRRAWLLIDQMNDTFGAPLVSARIGGARGGGAALTELGRVVATRYRLIEAGAESAAACHLDVLFRAMTHGVEAGPAKAGGAPE